MRVLLLITRRGGEILRIAPTLENMGYEVRTIFVDHYHNCHSYLAKKLDEMHIGCGKYKYDRSIFDRTVQSVNEWKADKALFVNFHFREEWRREFREKIANSQCQLLNWAVDPIRDINDTKGINAYRFFDKAFFFEKLDADAVAKKYGINAEYCPVGYNDAYEPKKLDSFILKKGGIDIAFVGSPYKSRMDILDRLAEVAEQRGWTLDVFGPFYDKKKYFWKKCQRMLRYPHLRRVVHDGSYTSSEVAKIYSRAKICLNIHGEGARGLNPRSYEIIATGSMELLDHRQSYDTLMVGEGFDEFVDFDNLVQKINFYLTNETERQKVIEAGQAKIGEFSMKKSLSKILKV